MLHHRGEWEADHLELSEPVPFATLRQAPQVDLGAWDDRPCPSAPTVQGCWLCWPKLGDRFWPGLSCGEPVLVEQSAQTLSASDPVDLSRERDHVRFVFGSTQKHSVALVAAPGVVMGDVDVEHVV